MCICNYRYLVYSILVYLLKKKKIGSCMYIKRMYIKKSYTFFFSAVNATYHRLHGSHYNLPLSFAARDSAFLSELNLCLS